MPSRDDHQDPPPTADTAPVARVATARYNPCMIQYLLVGAMVLAAGVYLLRRFARGAAGPRDGACRSCSCEPGTKPAADRLGQRHQIVELNSAPKRDGD
jgi:hypothetical protein